MRHLRIYNCFFKQYLKGLVTYRVDFLIGMFAFLINQGLGLLFLYIIFQNVQSLAGFTALEVVLMYGISQIPKGIDHLFFDNIWLLPQKVRNGTMDRYLLRPINPLYSFVIERFQPDAFGEIIIGIALSAYCITQGVFILTPIKIIGLLTLIFIGTFIFTAIKLLTASTSFWIKNSYPLMQISYELSDYTKYPIIIFPKVLRFIMTFIIPFALVSYYPVLYLLDRISIFSVLIIIIPVTFTLIFFAISTWKSGLRHYESTGS